MTTTTSDDFGNGNCVDARVDTKRCTEFRCKGWRTARAGATRRYPRTSRRSRWPVDGRSTLKKLAFYWSLSLISVVSVISVISFVSRISLMLVCLMTGHTLYCKYNGKKKQNKNPLGKNETLTGKKTTKSASHVGGREGCAGFSAPECDRCDGVGKPGTPATPPLPKAPPPPPPTPTAPPGRDLACPWGSYWWER